LEEGFIKRVKKEKPAKTKKRLESLFGELDKTFK
jgi:hypothetical protein